MSCRCRNNHLADHGALFPPVLLGPRPSLTLAKVSHRQWPLQEAGRACPKEAQGYWGAPPFPTSIATLVFTHFITLDFLLYFWLVCYHFFLNFQRTILFFHLFPCICSSYTVFLVFLFHSVLSPPLLFKMYISKAPSSSLLVDSFYFNSAISLAVGQCTKPNRDVGFYPEGGWADFSPFFGGSDNKTHFSSRTWM